jgi:hypothetical protein
MRLLISTLLVAGFAVSSALADGISKADVATAKGGHRVPQAHSEKNDVGVPQNQSSVVISVERGVRVWRPIVEATGDEARVFVREPQSYSADTQSNGNGTYNGGGYGGGFVGGGFGNGGGVAQNDKYANFVGAGGGQGIVRDNRDGKENNQLFVRDPRKRMSFERGNDRGNRRDMVKREDRGMRQDHGNRQQFAQRGDRNMPQVHRHGEALRMSPRDGGGRNMGPGPQMARPQMMRPHVAQRPTHMAHPQMAQRPHVQMGGPRMMMGGPKMHGPRPMARPMMKRMGGGRRH